MRSKTITILCVFNEKFKNAPGHLKFAATNFKKVAKEEFNREINVDYIYHGSKTNLKQLTSLTLKILNTKHDILYYGTDPSILIPISILKLLGIYRKPMFAWKYAEIERTKSKINNIIKWILYSGFNKIFMITESHVEASVNHGLIKSNQLKYLKWGEDIEFIDRCKVKKNDTFTFISTGKAHRDFATILKAFSKISNKARLILYLPEKWGEYNYSKEVGNINIPNVNIIRIGKGGVTLEKIYKDLFQSHCSLCICKPVNFGVGYTQILDSMACGVPVIWTYNKDNPIDVEHTHTGIFVAPEDTDALAGAMDKMIVNHSYTEKMSTNARKLIENEFNIKNVAENVLREFFRCIQ